MQFNIGPTLQTTYNLQLLVDGQWTWYSSAEYTSADAVRDQLRLIYGGAFAGSNMHRIVQIRRTILD